MSDCEHRRFLKNIVPVKTGDFRFDCPWCAPRPEDKKCEHDKGTQWDSLRTKYPNWVEKTSFPTCPFCRPEVKEDVNDTKICCCDCHEPPNEPTKTNLTKLATLIAEKQYKWLEDKISPHDSTVQLAKVALNFVKEIMPEEFTIKTSSGVITESDIGIEQGWNAYREALIKALES